MVDILSLVLHHDEDAVLCTAEPALEAGGPTKTHILNLLHRLIDKKHSDHPEADPPDALALETAPKANVDRHDGLRQAGETRHAS
ncbi:ISPsy20, transposase IstA [Mameliella alba]|uniref:ISPsy20, transposase IstA n=1 Tax=Mameliella alba TaxID=561184 RepID=A0A0B3S0J6_9RHOB|nr:ISPsy20, transposase IstA [Mameliella alba]